MFVCPFNCLPVSLSLPHCLSVFCLFVCVCVYLDVPNLGLRNQLNYIIIGVQKILMAYLSSR